MQNIYFQIRRKILVVSVLILIAFTINMKCQENDDITVHIIPHTHDDAGWLWTLEQYYLGTGGCNVSVKNILDHFVESLYHNPERTFIYVEIAFFTKWYKDQDELVKSKVKDLINQKRFEFINGGYVMHDEAASYYQHSIDQMRLGLLFLKQEFDYVPDVAWFIDPFGHSASNAFILSKMGFKKIVFVRIDNKEKDYRKAQKSLEFYWIPFGKIDENTRIFTHITFGHYYPPGGLDDFISDRDLNLSDSEIQDRANKLLENIKEINSKYRHKHHLLMYGGDFTHNVADNNFLNIERLMKFVNNANMGIKLIYSTPSKYFENIFSQVNDWPLYENQDFFPYGDGDYDYWTGYFTSRPYLKGLIREVGNYLSTVSKDLFDIIANSYIIEKTLEIDNVIHQNWSRKVKELINSNIEKLFKLREYLAICQHHDAVAGTARELVSEDYIDMLKGSLKISQTEFSLLMQEYLNVENFKVCMDPVFDFNCQENMFNTELNENFNLKVNKGKHFPEQNFLRNFYLNPDYEIKWKNNLELNDNEIEIFCIDGLKSNFPNCQVYFNNKFDFLVSKSNHSFSIINFK